MHQVQFEINIKASKEKVWESLWNDASYRKWTAAFTEGSYAESDWKEGSKILFLSPGGNGMFSIIDKMIPNEQMIFLHLGEIKNAVEEVKEWSGAKEGYMLTEDNGVTHVAVTLDTGGEMENYFKEVFPKALQLLKEITEKN